MNNYPPEFYDLVAAASEKTRIKAAVRASAPLVLPVHVRYRLPRYLQIWVEAQDLPVTSVIKACLDLGRYIQRAYPRAMDPETPYVQAVLSADRLTARTTTASNNTSSLIDQAKALIARATFSRNFSSDSPTPQQLDGPDVDDDLPDDPDDPISLPEADELEDLLAADAVTYLFETAHARKTTPEKLLHRCVAAGLFFDRNFVVLKPGASLSQLLILKMLEADKLARELSQTLSALETLIADWPAPFALIERRLNQAMEADHA